MSTQDNQKKSDTRYEAIDLRVRKLARQPRSVSRFYDLCSCIEDGAFIACRGSLDSNLDDQPWLWKCLDILGENPKHEDLTSTAHDDLDYAPNLRKMMAANFKKAADALLMWAEKTGGREYAPVENCFPCRVVFELDCPRNAAKADLREDGGGIWSRRAADTYEEILFNKRANGAIWTYRDESLFKVLRNYCRAPENDDYATSSFPQTKTATNDTLLINFVELDEERPQDPERSRANVVSEKLSRMNETFGFYARIGYYQGNEADDLSARGENIIRELHGKQLTPIRFSYLGLVEQIIETIYCARQLHEFYTGKHTDGHAVLLSDVLGQHTPDGISPRLQSFKMFCQTLGSANTLLSIDEYTDIDSWFKALLRILRRYIPGSACLDVQKSIYNWIESYDGLSDDEIDTRTYLPEVLKKLDAVITSFETLSRAFYNREQELLNESPVGDAETTVTRTKLVVADFTPEALHKISKAAHTKPPGRPTKQNRSFTQTEIAKMFDVTTSRVEHWDAGRGNPPQEYSRAVRESGDLSVLAKCVEAYKATRNVKDVLASKSVVRNGFDETMVAHGTGQVRDALNNLRNSEDLS